MEGGAGKEGKGRGRRGEKGSVRKPRYQQQRAYVGKLHVKNDTE